jgi:hypothetical protein
MNIENRTQTCLPVGRIQNPEEEDCRIKIGERRAKDFKTLGREILEHGRCKSCRKWKI